MKDLLSHLATHPFGRIALPILCALRSHLWLWHGRGIVRELSLLLKFVKPAAFLNFAVP